jgi:PST family polysaccharide transporter
VKHEVAAPSLSKSALSGVAWNYAGIAVLVVAQIASTAATARLIGIKGFGSYAAAQAAIQLGGYFSLQTLGLAVMRRKELGSKTVGTALTISAIAAIVTLVLFWFGADLWGEAWNNHSSAVLVRVMAFSLFFTSLASVPIALVRRRLRFGAAAIAETGSQVGGMTLSVVLAVLLHSATALAIGQVFAGVTLFISVVALAREDLRFGFDGAEGRDYLTYSSQVSSIYLGSYFINTLPFLFVSRVFGKFTLGLYSRTYMIVSIPLSYLSTSVTKVLFPLYARVRDDIARTRMLLSEGLTLATGFTWPAFALVGGAATVVVDTLLGSRWQQGIPFLRLSALIVAGLFPTGLLTNAAEALRWIRFAILRQVVLLALLVTTIVVVKINHLSTADLLFGVAITQWITYAIMLRTFVRREVIDSRLVLRGHLVHALVSAGAFGLAFVCARLLAPAGTVAQVAGEVVVVVLVGGVILTGRSWYPATQILARRLHTAFPAGSPWITRLRLEPLEG